MSYKTTVITLCLVLTLLVCVDYLNAWTTAPPNPPQNNAAAPINVGTLVQRKAGNFAANIVAALTEMRSDRYCNALGQNCISLQQTCTPGQTLIADATGTLVCANFPTTPTPQPPTPPPPNPPTPPVQQIVRSFYTQYAALIRDPAFLAWGSSSGLQPYTGSRCGAGPTGSTYRCETGWYHFSQPQPTLETYNKICSYLMVNGKYAAGAVLADYGSDNGNRAHQWSNANKRWSYSASYGFGGGIDAVAMSCIGDSVSKQGAFWLTSNHPSPTCTISTGTNSNCNNGNCTQMTTTKVSWASYRFRCNPFPIPPMR